MNEKIKQLADKAGVLQCKTPELGVEKWITNRKEVQKFAELIILECASVSLCIGSGDNETELLKHFGIECYKQKDLDEAEKRGTELASKLRIE